MRRRHAGKREFPRMRAREESDRERERERERSRNTWLLGVELFRTTPRCDSQIFSESARFGERVERTKLRETLRAIEDRGKDATIRRDVDASIELFDRSKKEKVSRFRSGWNARINQSRRKNRSAAIDRNGIDGCDSIKMTKLRMSRARPSNLVDGWNTLVRLRALLRSFVCSSLVHVITDGRTDGRTVAVGNRESKRRDRREKERVSRACPGFAE